MNDEAFQRKIEQVHDILEELRDGDITQERGHQVKQDAFELLDEAEQLLSTGQGKVVEVREQGGDIVEDSVEITTREQG